MKTKTLIILLMCSLMFLNCRSRRKTLQIDEYRSAEIEKIDTNTVVSVEKKIQELKEDSEKKKVSTNNNSGDIIIHGKTDSANDFHFHNVVDGDTLSDITISGNADFTIKNRWKKTDSTFTKESRNNYQNIIQEVARKAVAQSTIKGVAEDVKKLDSEVKSKGFTFGAYLNWIIIAGLVIAAVFFYFYLGGKVNLLSIFKNKKDENN